MSPGPQVVAARSVREAEVLLGVEPGASLVVVRSAWRAAVRHAHPDLGGDPDRFLAVSAAYELLQAAHAQRQAQDWVWAPPPSPPGPQDRRGEPQRPSPAAAVALVVTGLAEAGLLVGVAAWAGAPVVVSMAAVCGVVLLGRYAYLAGGRPHGAVRRKTVG